MMKQKHVALTLVASLFTIAACSSPTSSDNTGKSSGENKKLEVSVSILDRGQVASDEGTYESNRTTKYISEKSGINVKWVPILRTESTKKLNTLIAAGEAPDMMWEFGRDYMATLKEQGAIQPIDEYIEKYSTSYKAYLKAHPELKPYTMFDGKTYMATSARGIDAIANHGMWIRQDWLDKLGLKAPTTMDELVTVMRAFRDKDPDGNGKNDTLGAAFNYNYTGIIQAMYASNKSNWYLDNDKIVYGGLTDRYADVLAELKLFFDEGLIDKEYITDKNFQKERQLFVTGKAGIYFASWNISAEYRELKQNVPNSQLVPLEPVSTKYGKFGLYQEPPANRLIVFNKDMKNPEAAIKLLDWWIDKNWFDVRFGTEGVHYKLVNGVPQTIDAEKNKKETIYAPEYAVLDQWSPKPEDFAVMAATDAISQEYAKVQGESLKVAMKNKYRRDIPFNPTFPELSETSTSFGPLSDDIETKVITGGAQYSPQWGMEQLRKEWKRLGGDNVDKLAQDWYQKNVKGK
ncbi:extracellular solute-binding protein [Paenibacillus sp. CGMCC 1.16610]|uniref:Extracellular solute-binding protein n=1 Tax=Paenibacillus anseongense TaxID=2682845 RepID=A0ABW9U9D1_9BACL|nr:MULTISPECIES: extracellular solute-binding protein [Paenibacillus]MBA2937689.1 extracellular solute-binding protein [Paenibacillus sp. CGMCC 1.16610]MVQ36747.1 extracellular solute-binding protein [Paenibacillus anseongense]